MRRTLAVIAAYFHVVSSLSVQPPSGSLGKGPPGGPAPPQLPELEIAPPPSWGSPAWKWGRGDGAAHEVAKRVRADFAKRHRRSSFLFWQDLLSN